MLRRLQLKDISAVAAGRTALINCPIGPRYHRICLVIGDTAAVANTPPALGTASVPTSIGEIRLNYAGGIQRRVNAKRLDVINTAMGSVYGSQAYNSATVGASVRHLNMFFAEPWRKRSLDADALALQTGFMGKGDNMILEVDIGAAANYTGNPTLTAFAIVDDFNGGKLHPIMKWDTNDFGCAALSLELSKLDRRDYYAQMSLFDNSANPTVERVRIVQGSVEIFDLAKNENTTELINADMNPASGAFHVVFDIDDDLRNVVPASGLQLTATMSATTAGTVSLVAQRIGLPE